MLPRRDVSALVVALALVACGGATSQEDGGASALGIAGAGGSGASAPAGGSSAGGTTSNGGSPNDVSMPAGGPCDDHGGGTCGPTEYCSYAKSDACGVGGTCLPRPGGCITIANNKRPCMCSGTRTWDACMEMVLRGDSQAPFASACHPDGAPIACSSDASNGLGCGTREYCDPTGTGAAGSGTDGVCRPLPPP